LSYIGFSPLGTVSVVTAAWSLRRWVYILESCTCGTQPAGLVGREELSQGGYTTIGMIQSSK